MNAAGFAGWLLHDPNDAMKATIIPIAIGLLAGLGGGSGYAYMRIASRYTADSTRMANSLASRVTPSLPDSTVHDGTVPDSTPHDSMPAAAQTLVTAPDSVRAVGRAQSSGVLLAAPASEPAATTRGVTQNSNGARDQSSQTAIPERRLAKIFGAMAAKDATKVLDQMSDSDIRAILAMMGDRQAAAILAAFPAARAAAISKNAEKTPGGRAP
jgi:hypothetical protein